MNLEEVLPYAVNRCAFSIRQLFIGFIKDNGLILTPEESTILNQLWIKDGQTQSELAEYVFKGPSTVTRQIDSLVKKGLVTRQACSDDRRKVYAWLTNEGQSLEEKVMPMAEGFFQRIAQDISPEDIETTLKTLSLLRQNAQKLKQETK